MINLNLAVFYRPWTTSEHDAADDKRIVLVHEEEIQHIHENCESKHVCETFISGFEIGKLERWVGVGSYYFVFLVSE